MEEIILGLKTWALIAIFSMLVFLCVATEKEFKAVQEIQNTLNQISAQLSTGFEDIGADADENFELEFGYDKL